MDIEDYRTAGGIGVRRTVTTLADTALDDLARSLDSRRGGVLSSGVEYPGRYSRWHLGYIDPPIEIVARGRRLEVRALNERGAVVLPALQAAVRPTGTVVGQDAERIEIDVPEGDSAFLEEDRTRRPTVFDALRAIVAAFASDRDEHLGLYGAYGYDLALQFEPLERRLPRAADQRDLVLHLPDRILVVDRKREVCLRYDYELEVGSGSTRGLARRTAESRLSPPARLRHAPPPPGLQGTSASLPANAEPGSYAAMVEAAKARFARGDLFEVTPSHVIHARCSTPAGFYARLRAHNPAPYEFLFNLGEGEFLVAASPEMYVRAARPAPPETPSLQRIETCPIAGTTRRGADALEDSTRIRDLLNSTKDEAELTMCTDVDRNDKSRVCEPGSVRVIGRRQIEVYRRLIHTVDHIEGLLRKEFDAFDAFLTHMWAVTVTGAPKRWAMQFIEDHEASPRRWYGAAAGFVGFDGSMNTGLTLRAARIANGVAEIRVGATLLSDSDPGEEERETYLKAQALLDVLETPVEAGVRAEDEPEDLAGKGLRVLVVDHEDSFVLTLADYLRQQGAEVSTVRHGFDQTLLDTVRPDLVMLSPGPGTPSDFACSTLLKALYAREIPTFGVCLGLQAMVEYAGGTLDTLADPAHGKPGQVEVVAERTGSGDLLAGLGSSFVAGRYHSLYARPTSVRGFTVTASAVDPTGVEVAMAIEDPVRHRWAVQFHPESILTAAGRTGHRVVANALRLAQQAKREAGSQPAS